MSEHNAEVAAASPVTSGPAEPSTPLPPVDRAPGLALRAAILAVLLAAVMLWSVGRIPLDVQPWVLVGCLACIFLYWLSGLVLARVDRPRMAAEVTLGVVIAFLAAWGTTIVLPAPDEPETSVPSITIPVDAARVHLGDGSTIQGRSGPVKGRALVVTTTTDAVGIRSRSSVSLDVTWQCGPRRCLLTVPRGKEDATAEEATAALAGAEEVWLLSP
jgi:hypothetical protein